MEYAHADSNKFSQPVMTLGNHNESAVPTGLRLRAPDMANWIQSGHVRSSEPVELWRKNWGRGPATVAD